MFPYEAGKGHSEEGYVNRYNDLDSNIALHINPGIRSVHWFCNGKYIERETVK